MHQETAVFPMQMNTDPELFLSGFHFHCFDPEKLFEDKCDRKTLEYMIKFHGGEIEFEPSKFAEKIHQVTHVLIDSCRNPHVRPSLEHRKRIVSMQWIADVLEREKADIPWKLAHLPPPFNDNFRPHYGKLFALSGFDESERGAISFMAEAMGAKITPYLSSQNNLLIAKGPSEKVTKAQEWNVPTVNYQWIAESYVCPSAHRQDQPNVCNPRFQVGHECPPVINVPAKIEQYSAETAAMLCCWKAPIIIGDQAYDKAQANRKALQESAYYFPAKKITSQDPAPTDEETKENVKTLQEADEQWIEHQKKTKDATSSKDVSFVIEPRHHVRAWIGDGINNETRIMLMKKVKFLNGHNVEKMEHATHVILMSGRRSFALLEAIIRGKNIMHPEWITDSYKNKDWLDTMEYFLTDNEFEKALSYNCMRSVLRARHKPVFEDIEFHVTRFVEPDQKELVRLIELAGGIVHPERPDPKYLARCVETEQPFLIISCMKDSRFLHYLADANLPVYSVDLVLFAILRQVIEPLPQYRVPITVLCRSLDSRQPPPYTAPSAKEKTSPPPQAAENPVAMET